MIRILAGASPVLRNVKPSIGGVCVCALGHWGERQRSLLLRTATPKAYLGHIAVWICPRIPVNLQNHPLHELGEFWKRKPIFWALSGKLQRR